MKHSYFSIFSPPPKKYSILQTKGLVGWLNMNNYSKFGGWTCFQSLLFLSKNWNGSRSLGHFFQLYLVSMVICHSYLSLQDGMRLLKMVKGLVLKQTLGDQPPWRSWPRQVLIHHLPAFPGSMVGFTNHGNHGFHMGNQGKPNTKFSFF